MPSTAKKLEAAGIPVEEKVPDSVRRRRANPIFKTQEMPLEEIKRVVAEQGGNFGQQDARTRNPEAFKTIEQRPYFIDKLGRVRQRAIQDLGVDTETGLAYAAEAHDPKAEEAIRRSDEVSRKDIEEATRQASSEADVEPTSGVVETAVAKPVEAAPEPDVEEADEAQPEPDEEIPEKDDAPEIEGFEIEDASETDERIRGLEVIIDALESKKHRSESDDARLEAAHAELDVATKELEKQEHEQVIRHLDTKLEKLGLEHEMLLAQAPSNDVDMLPLPMKERVEEIQEEMGRLTKAKNGGLKELAVVIGALAVFEQLRSKADKRVRSFERKAVPAEKPKRTELRGVDTSGPSSKAHEKPHAMKRIATGVGVTGAVVASAGLLSFAGIAKGFSWLVRTIGHPVESWKKFKQWLHEKVYGDKKRQKT